MGAPAGIVFLLVFLLVLQLTPMGKCFNLVIDKSYQQVPSKQSFTILCQADVPLSACQIKRFYNLNIFFDLSRGNQTPSTFAISYAGAGLEAGQCGVTINKQSFAGGYNVYGCRARSGGGGWKHGVAVVDVSDGTYWTLPVVSGPSTVLADPGSNVTISFATGGTLNFCNFKWPGLSNWTRSGEDSTFSIDSSLLEEGKCELTLFNVSAETSGLILTDIRSKYRIKGKRGDFIQVTTLVVKAAPSPPVLTFSAGIKDAVNEDAVNKDDIPEAVNDGDVLDATCSVGAARPAARITWLLDGDVVRNDLFDDTDSGSVWAWEFDAQPMTQTLRRKVTSADHGKELICRVEHIALPGGRAEAKKTVLVRDIQGLVSFPSHVSWLLIGAGSSLLGVIVVLLTSWIVYACATGRRRAAKDETDCDRSSHIYDDVNLNLSNAGGDRDSMKTPKAFLEMSGRGSSPAGWQAASDCEAFV